MKLLTKEVLVAFKKQGDVSQKEATDVKIICKFFNPCGAGTWYAVEFNERDRVFFGWANLGDPQCAELGYFSLDELESLRCPPLGLPIERDLYFGDHTLDEVSVQGKQL